MHEWADDQHNITFNYNYIAHSLLNIQLLSLHSHGSWNKMLRQRYPAVYGTGTLLKVQVSGYLKYNRYTFV